VQVRSLLLVVDMITTKGGYLKLVGQTLMVILDWIEYGKHREAAGALSSEAHPHALST